MSRSIVAALTVLLLLLPLFACSDAGDAEKPGDAATATPGAAQAGRDPGVMPSAPQTFPTEFVAACMKVNKMTTERCQCLAEAARAELEPHTYEFLVASLAQNKKRANKLREKLTQKEASSAGTFMMNAMPRCISETTE